MLWGVHCGTSHPNHQTLDSTRQISAQLWLGSMPQTLKRLLVSLASTSTRSMSSEGSSLTAFGAFGVWVVWEVGYRAYKGLRCVLRVRSSGLTKAARRLQGRARNRHLVVSFLSWLCQQCRSALNSQRPS